MIKNVKHYLILCLTLIVLVSLVFTGCSSTAPDSKEEVKDNTEAAAGETKDSGEKTSYTIGFSNFSVGNSWRVQMEAEFKAEAEKFKSEGVIKDVIMTNSNGDISKQIADVKDLITKKVDAIIITASSPSALSPVVEEAMSKGIKVVSFDNYVETDNITAKVGIDEVEFGRKGGQFLADALSGKGNIIVLNGAAGTAVNEMRYNGAKEIFAKYPDIKILGEANADWDYAKGKAAVENFLSAYPQIDAVWSQGGAMTQAAIDAFIAAGRPLVPMSGEANNGMLKLWKANVDKGFDSIAPSSPTYLSASALDVAIDALQGKTIEKNVVLDVPVVTKDNLDDYVKPDLPDSYWNITKLSEEDVKTLFSK
ncbi:ABC transporter substrate-binding protein [Petroclostridium sp. X23]|uniref:ABC transporter substrate-binding protein n=1 Tax=Petroclostridium sp. X23 TaxID=3045146 RepID=UPI0024AD21BD|nr:ABC transporter substrate-binding protein [Petroclostridium sp. X23]WHH58177.1 ABC transporter substrate-binding protein [Petroclostridium sp. X23]